MRDDEIVKAARQMMLDAGMTEEQIAESFEVAPIETTEDDNAS